MQIESRPRAFATGVCLCLGGLMGCSSLPASQSGEQEASCPNDRASVAAADLSALGPRAVAVRAGLLAALEFGGVSSVISDRVADSCSKIALQMGAGKAQLKPKEYRPGAEATLACEVASQRLGDVVKNAGAALTTMLAAGGASCERPLAEAHECLDRCAPGWRGRVECDGQIRGKCQGTCEGRCVLADGADCHGLCQGACNGACESEFEGACSGRCDGSCDGKRVAGSCEGVCKGSCSKGPEGTCGGTCSGECSGACVGEADGTCPGVCEGSCSQAMQATQCDGELSLPKTNDTCQFACEAKVLASAQCEPMGPRIQGASGRNPDEAAQRVAAVVTEILRLHALLEVSKDRSIDLVQRSKAVVQEPLQTAAANPDLPQDLKNCLNQAAQSRAESAEELSTAIQAAITLEDSLR